MPRNMLWTSLVGTVKGIFEDDCHGIATQIAYHWIYALFPGLFVMFGVLTALGANPGFLSVLAAIVERAIPGESRALVDATLVAMRESMAHGTAPVLGLGLIGVLWVASNGFDVVMGGLNRAYRVTEFRPFWYRRLLAVVLVIGVGFGLITAFEILLVGSQMVQQWMAGFTSTPQALSLYTWARWPAYFLIASAVGLALYTVGPAPPKVDWRWTVPGAILFGLAWVIIGYGFDRYLTLYGKIDKLYGILGAFLVLMTWLYLTAFAFMVGGELNGQVRWRYLEHPIAPRVPVPVGPRGHRADSPAAPAAAVAPATAAETAPGDAVRAK
jgi:membrane protein